MDLSQCFSIHQLIDTWVASYNKVLKQIYQNSYTLSSGNLYIKNLRKP
jgi:hypothetical protein